ncbi:hypothetical protein N7532_010306 [Penicillium argentinense]|uniref:Uncharacterized protein n=1 Tax=Penicillium argentinense TaxID=1131581 RepID=A0A9W9EPJ4_9EURO|nr:uncharacterized protein N7532_010306 [Penicillium argentinense]KAJ5085535.1 hypothetical protein N7532_010306 [Penicillium argentinense]
MIERNFDEAEYMEWIYFADRLETHDMKGLIAWFESENCDYRSPPSFFMAMDRWTLDIVNDTAEANDTWAECIFASKEGGEYVLSDNRNISYAEYECGYGYWRDSFEESIVHCMQLEHRNQHFTELGFGEEHWYWKVYRKFAAEFPMSRDGGLEDPRVPNAYFPGQGRVELKYKVKELLPEMPNGPTMMVPNLDWRDEARIHAYSGIECIGISC